MPPRRGHASDHDHMPPQTTSLLRARGRRLTRQRAVICDVLSGEPDAHLSADEVAKRVRVALPDVNASTVYRTLDLLVDEGLVRRTDLGQGRSYYEPAQEHLHHHLVCDACGAVTHVHDGALGSLAEHVKAETGFTLGDRELTLHGLCARCAGRTEKPEGS